jgi:hypothetical protein
MNSGDVNAPASRLYSSRVVTAEHTTPGRKEGQMDVSIRVKGHLDPSWQEWLEGLEIVHEADGISRLFGSLQDQPALYGVLAKISRLNLTLLSFESSELTHNETIGVLLALSIPQE